jgi:act minimal PKS acyl carrier protein
MSTFTLAELIRIMRECAGEDDQVDLDGEVAEVDFAELGYDSLALLETAGRVAREWGVSLPDEELSQVRTPAGYVTLVNRELARSGAGAATGAGD